MKKIFLTVISSTIFAFVVGFGVLFFGIHVLSWVTAKKVGPEGPVPGLFYVVAEPGEAGAAFKYIDFSEIHKLRESGSKFSFLMSKPEGFIDTGGFRVRYKVLEDKKSSQLLKVTAGDDEIMTETYLASEGDVSPVSWQLLSPGQMFMAAPFAFLAAFLMKRWGRSLKAKNAGVV